MRKINKEELDEGVVLTNRQKEIIRNSIEYELETYYGELEEDVAKEMRAIIEKMK